jgi:hypothetical protein
MRVFNWELFGPANSNTPECADMVCVCLSELGLQVPTMPVFRLAADCLDTTPESVEAACQYVSFYEVGNYSTFDYEVIK